MINKNILVLICLLFLVNFSYAAFDVNILEYYSIDANGNKKTIFENGEVFYIKMTLKNIGDEIKTGQISLYCYSDPKVGWYVQACGPENNPYAGTLGTKKLTMAKGEKVTIIASGKFSDLSPLGNHSIYAYIDATSQAMYILKQGAYPTISVFYNNLNKDWEAVYQDYGVEVYTPKKPTGQGEKYDLEFNIFNGNKISEFNGYYVPYWSNPCDNYGKKIVLTIPAGGKTKVKLTNCTSYAGINYPGVSVYGSKSQFIRNIQFNFYPKDPIVYWKYIYVNNKGGPITAKSNVEVRIMVGNIVNGPLKKNFTVNMLVEELAQTTKIIGVISDKNYLLGEDIAASQYKEIKLKFKNIDHLVRNYKISMRMYDDTGKQVAKHWPANYIINLFVPDITADINKSSDYKTKDVECKYYEKDKKRNYDCIVKKSGLIWVEFNFKQKEFSNDENLVVFAKPTEILTYKAGSVWVNGDPLNGKRQYTISAKSLSGGLISMPDFGIIESLLIILICFVISTIYIRKSQKFFSAF